MRIFLVALLTCFSVSAIIAQNGLKLVMDTKPIGSVIKISKYLGDLQIPLDSIRYRGESEIKFEYDARYTDGVYAIDVSTLETFQFVLMKKENITAHIYESGSGMAFKCDGSKENDAFNIMLNLSEVYSKSMDTLTFAMDRLSDFAPRHDAVTDSLTNVYHQIAEAYNHSLDLCQNLFPNSYTAQVLIPLDRIPLRIQRPEWNNRFDNDAAFNHVHYFELIDFADERIVSNPFLSNKVLEYLYSYTERSEFGVKQTIDKLLGFPKMHPKVQAFIIDLLVDFFTEKEAPEFIDHLNRKYLGTCELPLSKEALQKIEKMAKFKPGDAVPNMKLPGQTGHLIPVSSLAGQLNVIVFWASSCSHCVRELPKLQGLYTAMSDKLGVYAVSLDTAKTDWLNTISHSGAKWFNVNDQKGWDSEYLQSFTVTSTPSLILLDDQLRYIGRSGSFDGLHELIKAAMVE